MPVNAFTWLWALWIAFFLVVEGVAVFRERANAAHIGLANADVLSPTPRASDEV